MTDLDVETAGGPQADGPAAVAVRVAQVLRDKDRVGRTLGIELTDIAPGRARMTMEVREDMVSGHGLCHGAYIFALADTACAFAGSSHNVNTLCQGMNLAFVSPARLGDRLVADVSETAAGGRSAYYDVRITGRDGAIVAIVRGQTRSLAGHIVEDERAP